uniref:leucine-rich repeat-containing protein 15-like n=1 Tax=Styela clava TaxID=7725 RepID=UPI00193A4A6D|nr:leucine-rich repeat-containing protein 15-like [Styela clava]
MSFLKILAVIFIVMLSKAASETAEAKCTEKDPRQVYPYCMYSIADDSLWCDQSKYKRLPSVDEINRHLAPNRNCTLAKKLYVNDSCLQEISEDDLRPYQGILALYGDMNSIVHLASKTFEKNKELEKIHFCSNKIRAIDLHAFKGLKQLKHVHLDNNEITELHSGTFVGLSSLLVISLKNNKLKEIGRSHFQNLNNLKTLQLQGNFIQRIEDRTFSTLTGLKNLHLDNNKISVITPRTFSGLEGLETLTLTHNGIRSWPRTYGVVFVNLQTLHLGSNAISEIFLPEHVENVAKLRYLSLDNNLISKLHPELFHATPELQHLNLSSNSFEDIPADAFETLSELHSLILKDNRLKTPKSEWFKNVIKNANKESNVGLEMNDWICDCGILSYLQYVEDLHKHENPTVRSLARKLQIVCHSPAQYQNKLLTPEVGNEIISRQNCPHSIFEILPSTTPAIVEKSNNPDDEEANIPKHMQSSTEIVNTISMITAEVTDNLNTGVIVGIVVGLLCAVVAIIVALGVLHRYKFRKADSRHFRKRNVSTRSQTSGLLSDEGKGDKYEHPTHV